MAFLMPHQSADLHISKTSFVSKGFPTLSVWGMAAGVSLVSLIYASFWIEYAECNMKLVHNVIHIHLYFPDWVTTEIMVGWWECMYVQQFATTVWSVDATMLLKDICCHWGGRVKCLRWSCVFMHGHIQLEHHGTPCRSSTLFLLHFL